MISEDASFYVQGCEHMLRKKLNNQDGNISVSNERILQRFLGKLYRIPVWVRTDNLGKMKLKWNIDLVYFYDSFPIL